MSRGDEVRREVDVEQVVDVVEEEHVYVPKNDPLNRSEEDLDV